MAAASDGAEDGIDAYVEASVLVAKTVIEDAHHADAARVLDEAARSGWRLITTYAVILEVIDAVRRKVIASHRRQSGARWSGPAWRQAQRMPSPARSRS